MDLTNTANSSAETVEKSPINHRKIFENQHVLFAGFEDQNLESFIKASGGTYVKKLDMNTSLVIYNDSDLKSPIDTTSAYYTAKSLDIKCLPKSYFTEDFLLQISSETDEIEKNIYSGDADADFEYGYLSTEDPLNDNFLSDEDSIDKLLNKTVLNESDVLSDSDDIPIVKSEMQYEISNYDIKNYDELNFDMANYESRDDFPNIGSGIWDGIKDDGIEDGIEDDILDIEDDLEELQTKDVEEMCKLLKKHHTDFFDDIWIPYQFFNKHNFKISTIVRENKDALFFNEEYMTDADKNKFNEIFDKYCLMIEQIFVLDSQLGKYLKIWSKKKEASYLKIIMTEDDYQIINPVFLADTYKKLHLECKPNNELLDKKYKECLDGIIEKFYAERKEFEDLYHEVIDTYVHEYPLEMDETYYLNYTKGFINSIILLVMDFAEKLIDLNIYAIHPVINNVIEYYVPLDLIYTHEDKKRKNIMVTI